MLKTTLPQLARTFARDRRGNIAIIASLSMPVLLGFVGLGAEVSSWYGGKREMQNAADTAAIAAASNAHPERYDDEARAVAARYGFHDGQGGVTVTASNTAPCPSGGTSDCYSVTINKLQPMLLAQVVGVTADAMLNGSPAKLIVAKATAKQANGPRDYCILALAGSGHPEALRANGVPFANLSGCNTMSNSNATCNGHDLEADNGDAHGINNGCGNKQHSNVDTVKDPYADRATKIPSHTCSSYAWRPESKKEPDLPSANQIHGLQPFTGVKHVCGDLRANGPVYITEPNTVIVIHGGSLDIDEASIVTQGEGSLTIIFTGPHVVTANHPEGQPHIPMGDGTLDVRAPTTGDWRGIAMYQDPALSSGVDIKEAGNTPTWMITGLVYLPKASVTFSGAVNKAANGAACFGLVVDNLRVNGAGSILAHGECPEAGLTLPYSLMPGRGELVS